MVILYENDSYFIDLIPGNRFIRVRRYRVVAWSLAVEKSISIGLWELRRVYQIGKAFASHFFKAN
jgi:hypothetical protein